MAASHLGAALLQLLYQTKTLSTAVLGVVILGKALRMNQWAALTILVAGVVMAQAAEPRHTLPLHPSAAPLRCTPQLQPPELHPPSCTPQPHTAQLHLPAAPLRCTPNPSSANTSGPLTAQGGDDSQQKGGALNKGNVTIGVAAALGVSVCSGFASVR